MNEVPARQELTVSATKVQIYGMIGAIAIFLLFSLPFNWLHGRPVFRFEEISAKQGLIIVLIGFAGIAVHELIHGLTAIWYAGIRREDAHFGFQWKSMTPYFHSKVPIRADRYRIVIVMPLIILGIIPYLAGMAAGDGWLTTFGIVFIISAGGDMLILWLMRKVPPRQLVQDHSEKIGLIVLGERDNVGA